MSLPWINLFIAVLLVALVPAASLEVPPLLVGHQSSPVDHLHQVRQPVPGDQDAYTGKKMSCGTGRSSESSQVLWQIFDVPIPNDLLKSKNHEETIPISS